MKKLFVFLTVIAASTIFATLKYNPMTDRFYSENAPKNVDQDKYGELFEIIEIEYIFNLTNHQLAQLFAILRIEGGPEGLQAIHDIEEVVQMYREEAMQMNQKDIKRLLDR